MPNVVQLWLEIIGTPERAKRLLTQWQGDPAVVLLGARGAELAYANPLYRPALDSWDCGLTTRRDLQIWAAHVASGKYKGHKLIVVDGWAKLRARTPQLQEYSVDSTASVTNPEASHSA